MDGIDLRTASRINAEIKANPSSNCYQMCFANADNLVYQIGKLSWFL